MSIILTLLENSASRGHFVRHLNLQKNVHSARLSTDDLYKLTLIQRVFRLKSRSEGIDKALELRPAGAQSAPSGELTAVTFSTHFDFREVIQCERGTKTAIVRGAIAAAHLVAQDLSRDLGGIEPTALQVPRPRSKHGRSYTVHLAPSDHARLKAIQGAQIVPPSISAVLKHLLDTLELNEDGIQDAYNRLNLPLVKDCVQVGIWAEAELQEVCREMRMTLRALCTIAIREAA